MATTAREVSWFRQNEAMPVEGTAERMREEHRGKEENPPHPQPGAAALDWALTDVAPAAPGPSGSPLLAAAFGLFSVPQGPLFAPAHTHIVGGSFPGAPHVAGSTGGFGREMSHAAPPGVWTGILVPWSQLQFCPSPAHLCLAPGPHFPHRPQGHSWPGSVCCDAHTPQQRYCCSSFQLSDIAHLRKYEEGLRCLGPHHHVCCGLLASAWSSEVVPGIWGKKKTAGRDLSLSFSAIQYFP